MINFHNSKELTEILSHPYYVPHPAKVDLVELLEDVLELKVIALLIIVQTRKISFYSSEGKYASSI